jgi:hypothetical protein
MDYDLTDIPAAYDRGRSHGPEALSLWMNAVSVHVRGKAIGTILDLGCGTGSCEYHCRSVQGRCRSAERVEAHLVF